MPGFLEGREGVKWDLGFSSYIFTGKMVFGSLGLGITKIGNHKNWESHSDLGKSGTKKWNEFSQQ